MSIREYINKLLDEKSIVINKNTLEADKTSSVRNITVKLKDGTIYDSGYVTQWYVNRLRHFKYRNKKVVKVEKMNNGNDLVLTVGI